VPYFGFVSNDYALVAAQLLAKESTGALAVTDLLLVATCTNTTKRHASYVQSGLAIRTNTDLQAAGIWCTGWFEPLLIYSWSWRPGYSLLRNQKEKNKRLQTKRPAFAYRSVSLRWNMHLAV
jgi:hypothetical protein